MNVFKAVKSLSGLVVLASFLVLNAQADEWNRKSIITFSGPVEIPGVHLAGWGVLPAGTYVFKIMDSQSNRHIVQIMSENEKTIYATILAIPNYRLRATDKTVMTFRERPAGQPEALRAWFYPGRNWGEEFVYPKQKAIALAKETNTPILFTPATLPVEVTKPIQSVNEPVIAEMKRAPILAIQPSGEEVQLAAVVTPPPANELEADVAQSPAPSDTNSQPEPARTLPDTASNLTLVGLLGLALFGAGLAVSATRKLL